MVGDQNRLQQVLLNLAENAVKFTERGRVGVRIRTLSQAGDTQIEFAVHDTGIGIPPFTVERLFQPFVQADASISRRFGGSGLGLFISKSLVEMMGGQIRVEERSRQGKHILLHCAATVGGGTGFRIGYCGRHPSGSFHPTPRSVGGR